jgi:hypothetical protein
VTVTLIPPAPSKGKISLAPTREVIIHSPEETEERTDAISYALRDEIPRDQIMRSLQQGFEEQLRKQAALQEQIKERKFRQRLVSDVSRAAAADNRPITEDERQYIMTVSSETIQTSPETVFEHLYTKRLVEDILAESDEVEQALESGEDVEEETQEVLTATEDFMTKQQIAMTIMQEVKTRADQAPLVGKAWAFVKGLIPFYTWVQQRDRIQTSGGSLLLGANIEDQMRTLYLGGVEEFGPRLRAAVEALEKENILEALSFASAAVSYSGSDALWDNLFTGLDAVDVATLGTTAGIGAVVSTGRLVKKAKSVTSASATPGATQTTARQVISGNISGASHTQAAQRLITATTNQISAGSPTPHQNLRALMGGAQSILDPKAYTRNPGSLSNERASRLEDIVSKNVALLISTMTDVSHIGRISDEAAERGFAIAEAEFRRTYRNLEDTIVEVRPIRESEEVFGGVDHIEILLGRKDATGFRSEAEAQNFASKMYRLPSGSYTIKNEAGNFFIRLTKTIDETDPRIADARIMTENATPTNLANVIIGALRSNTYLVSKENARWRHVATYGANAVLSRLAAVAEPLAKLGKNEAARLKDILDGERVRVSNGANPMRTVAEFEQEYSTRFSSLPTDNEIAAWSTYRTIADYAWAMDNVSVYRDKARLGIEQKSIGFSRLGEDGRWHYVNSDFFEARSVENLPTTQEPYGVMWMDVETGRMQFAVSDRNPFHHESLAKALAADNHRVLQVANPRDPVLKGMLDAKGESLARGEPVHYVIVRDIKTKPLNPLQVPYSADLPFHDTGGFFVKQARAHKTGFGRRVLDGDTVVQRTASNAEGRTLVDAYEQGRQMVRAALSSSNANLSHVTAFVQAHLPFASARDFIKMFRGAPGAPDDAPFDLDTPFVLTASGQRSGDVRTYDSMWDDGAELVNPDLSSHNLDNFVTQNVGTNKLGTQQTPIVGVNAAATIDPYTVIARAGERLARARFYDDYVHRSVEDWLHEHADTMNVNPAVLSANPMRFFQEPVWRTDYQDRTKMAAAQQSRRAILQMLGQDTQESKIWKWVRQKTVDQIFRARGIKASNIAEAWAFTRRDDPIAIARAGVFHARLGLFNVVQFPLQGSAIVHAAAIDGNPLRAVQAQFAYWGMRMRGLSEVNPKAQGHLTKRVSAALGVSETVLDEMYEAWRRSGMGIVSGEYGSLDDYLNPKMFFGKGKVGKALNAGTFFFKEGNNWHRGTAFATAFLRWRHFNPEARVDNRALKEIVDRADLMYINMARDSNARWQQGFPSVASTFFAYHARMAEQLLGFRLTSAEKLRLMGTYSLMWGVPIGTVGAAVGVFWPAGEAFQQAALEQGQDVDGNVAYKLFNEGLVDMVLQWASGEDFNVNERFGPGGLSWLRDLLDGNFFDVATGASGSWIGDLIATSDNFVGSFVSIFDDKPGFELNGFVDAARNISSVNNMVKAWQVWNTGQWLSKNDDLLKDGEAENILNTMMAAMGITPDEIAEAYLMIRSNRQYDQVKRAIEKDAMLDIERGLRAIHDGDQQLGKTLFQRAKARFIGAGYTPLEYTEVFKRAIKINYEMIETVGQDFVRRDPETRLEPYLRRQEEE